MAINKSKLHPYQNADNWVVGGSCVFWDKETHVVAKYEQMHKELKRRTVRFFTKKQSIKSIRSGKPVSTKSQSL